MGIQIPAFVAYFLVTTSERTTQHATSVVGRYLYRGEVAGVEILDDYRRIQVLVRVEFGEVDRERIDYLLQYQRDRFTSGLMATSDPLIYVQEG